MPEMAASGLRVLFGGLPVIPMHRLVQPLRDQAPTGVRGALEGFVKIGAADLRQHPVRQIILPIRRRADPDLDPVKSIGAQQMDDVFDAVVPACGALAANADAARLQRDVVMEFTKLDYISSAGLRVLLSAHKAMSKKGGMKVTHVNEMVMEVFEVTGFSDILTVE